jgi:hypothetical protein
MGVGSARLAPLTSDLRTSEADGETEDLLLPENQEMLDYCAEHGTTSDVEVISIQQINFETRVF